MTLANDAPTDQGTGVPTDDHTTDQPSGDAPFHHAKYVANKAVYRRLIPERMTDKERMTLLHKWWATRVKELAERGWPAVAGEGRLDQVAMCSLRPPGKRKLVNNPQLEAKHPLLSCYQIAVCPFCYAKQVLYPLANTWRDTLKAVDRASEADPSLPPAMFASYRMALEVDVRGIPRGLIGVSALLNAFSRMTYGRLSRLLVSQLLGGTIFCALAPTAKPFVWEFRYAVNAMMRLNPGVEAPTAGADVPVELLPNPTLTGLCDALADSVQYPVGNMQCDAAAVVDMMSLPRRVRAPLTQRFGACRKSNKSRAGRGKGVTDDE